MRILALIPARSGSKRLPGKNLLPLGGKPLIAWSIDAVLGLPSVVDVLVSTDDLGIAATARESGACVPWLRPAELATDTASSVDVALHALESYESTNGPLDGLMLLQPTSPFRTRDTIVRGISYFEANNGQAVIGVSVCREHPLRALTVVDDTLQPWGSTDALGVRSQDLPPAYSVTGGFYLLSPGQLRKEKSFFPLGSIPLVANDFRETIDIDTEEDYQIAQALLSMQS